MWVWCLRKVWSDGNMNMCCVWWFIFVNEMEGFCDNFIFWVLLFGIWKMFFVLKVWYDRLKIIILWLLLMVNVYSIRECFVGIIFVEVFWLFCFM